MRFEVMLDISARVSAPVPIHTYGVLVLILSSWACAVGCGAWFWYNLFSAVLVSMIQRHEVEQLPHTSHETARVKCFLNRF